MIELSLQPTSEKFIASLVKSLQILCNGQVDFKESIELIGHINVKVDHEHKYNYIVDEHVTKGNNSSSTTFHSNSYHSPPPTKVLSTQPTQPGPQSQPCHNPNVSFNLGLEPTTSVANRLHTVEVSQKPANSIKRQDNVLVKSEGSENDCMVLPVSPEFEPSEVTSSKEGQILPTSAAPSGSYEVSYGTQPGNLTNLTENKRQIEQNNVMVGLNLENTELTSIMNGTEDDQNPSGLEDDLEDKKLDLMKLTKETFAIPNSINELKASLSNIASMLNLQVKPIDNQDMSYMSSMTVDIKSVKKHFMDHMDKEKIQKLKKIMKMKNGKRKKQEFKSVVAECGLSEELLRSLFKSKSKGRDDSRGHKKSLRIRAHERQQKLLEMAESLKRSKGYSSSTVVVSKLGNKKISLHKSSVSIFSYQTQFLTSDNMEDAAEALSGRMNKYGRHCDKLVDKKTMSTSKCQHLKRKIRHLVNRISKEINESGYRITFSNTIGSDVEFHSAELSVIPIKVDELFPEVKDDPKLEMSEDDYAKHLERQHFIEKQKANETRIKELELQLTQILSGVDEVLVTKRKRYGPGISKPTDAERMKQFRKKLKEDPSKYQEYKQKRVLTTKKKRLSTLAAKMKDSSTSRITNTDVNEENHNAPSLSLPQTVTSVNIHCPPGYVLPSSHQAPTPTVNLLNTAQYVGQVPGMQSGHQHQQTLPYTGEMDIVELIAATHNVQNQHFA